MRALLARSWWHVALLGVAALAFALVWLIAFYAIVIGVLFIALGFRLRSAGAGAPTPRAA